MVGYSKFILAASVVVGLTLVGQTSAQADNKKKAEGDDFSEKLKDRFPNEAKRGKKSIFRSVKESDAAESKKEETKKVSKTVKPEKKDSETEEKPKLMLADLFKSKPKKDEGEKETAKVVADKKKTKAADEEVKVEEGEKPKLMLADLFKSKPKETEDEKAPPKKETEKAKKTAAPAVAKKDKDEDEKKDAKPKMTFADFFKGKSKDSEEKDKDDALKAATENGGGSKAKAKDKKKPMLIAQPSDSDEKLEKIKDEKKSAARISTPKFFGQKSMKAEEPTVAETAPAKPEEKKVATVIKDAETEKDKAEEKEEKEGMSLTSKLFGKKDKDKEKEKKPEGVVIPKDSATLKPVPKVTFSKVDTSKDLGDGGDFTNWDDVPGSKKSTVDRMMGKLNVKPAAPRPAPRLPGGASLPGGPSKKP